MTAHPTSTMTLVEYLSDSDDAEKTSVCKTPSQPIFYIARATPAKLAQRLHLRSRLILQAQIASSTGHALPVLEFWHPGIFGTRVSRTNHPGPKPRTSDIYVCRTGNSPTGGKDIECGDDTIIAVIRHISKQPCESNNVIYFQGRPRGEVMTTTEGRHQCIWEREDGELVKIVSHSLQSTDSAKQETVIRILEYRGATVDLARVDQTRITMLTHGKIKSSLRITQIPIEVPLAFALWISMK